MFSCVVAFWISIIPLQINADRIQNKAEASKLPGREIAPVQHIVQDKYTCLLEPCILICPFIDSSSDAQIIVSL